MEHRIQKKQKEGNKTVEEPQSAAAHTKASVKQQQDLRTPFEISLQKTLQQEKDVIQETDQSRQKPHKEHENHKSSVNNENDVWNEKKHDTPNTSVKNTPSKPRTNDTPSSLKEAADLAQQRLGEALNKKPNATTSISKEGDNWRASVEIVEEEYLPGKNLRSMNDIIGVYEVILNTSGELESWEKKHSHKRGHL
jgi:hypothetical protein